MLLNPLFDAIFLINLLERQDRLKRALAECNAHGINTKHPNFQIWPATKDENGAKGLFLTMIVLFKWCKQNGFKRVLVLEDDVKFLGGLPLLENCFKEVQFNYGKWDLIHLGPNLDKPFRHIDIFDGEYDTAPVLHTVLPIQSALATHAIIYNETAIEKLTHISYDGKPYDVVLNETIIIGENSYCTYPMMATQFDDYSDIENIHVSYGHLEQKFYREIAKLTGV